MDEEHIIAMITAREPLTHRLPPGSGRVQIEALLAPDFTHIGASGRMSTRAEVIEVVLARYAKGLDPDDARWECRDHQVRRVAQDLRLATYALSFEGRDTLRSTLWRLTAAGELCAVHHQGTPR